MIDYSLDEVHAVLRVRPTGPLRAEDFDTLARVVDPFIERTGRLRGLLLETAHFPGWTDLPAAVRHFRFVHDHHRRISKVAVVTDSPVGNLAEHIAAHFVAAEVRHFPSAQRDEAGVWLAAG